MRNQNVCRHCGQGTAEHAMRDAYLPDLRRCPGFEPRPEATDFVTVELSRPAATFLRAAVEHMNQRKMLPAGDAQALQTSAWLEEIEAQTRKALDA